VILGALVAELDLCSGAVAGLLVDEDLQVVLDFAVELPRGEVDCEADVPRVLELDFLVKLECAVDVGFKAEPELVLITLLDFEMDCEIMTLMRLALREELVDDFALGISLEFSILLL
jgi:hypothetical protein